MGSESVTAAAERERSRTIDRLNGIDPDEVVQCQECGRRVGDGEMWCLQCSPMEGLDDGIDGRP